MRVTVESVSKTVLIGWPSTNTGKQQQPEEDEAEVVKDHRLGRGIVGETGTAKF